MRDFLQRNTIKVMEELQPCLCMLPHNNRTIIIPSPCCCLCCPPPPSPTAPSCRQQTIPTGWAHKHGIAFVGGAGVLPQGRQADLPGRGGVGRLRSGGRRGVYGIRGQDGEAEEEAGDWPWQADAFGQGEGGTGSGGKDDNREKARQQQQ